MKCKLGTEGQVAVIQETVYTMAWCGKRPGQLRISQCGWNGLKKERMAEMRTETGKSQIIKDSYVVHGKNLGFYLKFNGKPWKVFSQGRDRIQFMFKISLATERQQNC